MPRNPALSKALTIARQRGAECNATMEAAILALDNAESALSALGTAALIVDVRAQRDRWLNIERELACLVGDDAPAGEQGKVCPMCGGRGNVDTAYQVKTCQSCGGSGYVEIR